MFTLLPFNSPLRGVPPAVRQRVLQAAERDAGLPQWQRHAVLLGACVGGILMERFAPNVPPGVALVFVLITGAGLGLGWWWIRHAVADLHIRRHLAWEGRCPNCGYDRQGTPLRCPECGSTDQG